MRRWAWVPTALALLQLPVAASGQSWEDQARQDLETRAHSYRIAGFTPTSLYFDTMDQGETAIPDLDLYPGDYVVLGECDDDCTDLNLDGWAFSSSRVLGTARGAHPVLAFTLTEDDWVWFTVSMKACSANPCRFALALLERHRAGQAPTTTAAYINRAEPDREAASSY